MNDQDIDFLLARGRRSGRQREETLDRILDRVVPGRATNRRAWLAGASMAAAAAAASRSSWRGHMATEGPFAARGTSGAAPRVDLVCAGGSLDACPQGSRLLFAASAGGRTGYLAAYAEPVGGGGDRVWYFSAEHTAPVLVAGAGGAAPLDAAVQIGPEHRAGRYFVHLVVAARPLSREEALRPPAAETLSSETIPLDVVP